MSYFDVLGTDLVSFDRIWPSKDEGLEMLSCEMLLVVIVMSLLSCISYTDYVYM